MKIRIIILVSLCSLFLFISCQKESEKVEPIFQRVKTILEQHPDSALILLEEIPNPQSLKKSLYYRYYLLQIQAKDKSYQDITSDTLIFSITRYYQKKNDNENAAFASFYSGKVLQEQGKYEEALHTYLSTEKYLGQSNNSNLKGLLQSAIGSIYDEELIQDKAIVHFKKAKKHFRIAKNYKNDIITSILIGNCFLMEEKPDSAFSFYFNALSCADSLGYEQEQATILESIGGAYREIKDWGQAEVYFRKAWSFTTDSLDKARTSLNLAYLFEQMKQTDSAAYYIQSSFAFLPNDADDYLVADIYEIWSAIDEKSGAFQDALEKYKTYSDYLAKIFDKNREHAVMEVEKKYNFQRIINRNKQLVIQRQRILLFAIMSLLIVVILVFVFYNRSKENKRKLKETEQKVQKLKKLANSFNKKEESFRTVLLRHFDILKKAALLEGYLKEDDKKKGKHLLLKFNEIVYGHKNLDWELLYKTLNTLNHNFFNNLKERFPQLDESEFRICCLLAVDFSNTEVAIILNYSINTIHAKRSSIRKKLGIKPFGNIQDFLSTDIKHLV